MTVDLEKLTKPFPESSHKQRTVGGGKSLTYVEGHTVIHRLNEATGNRWDFAVLDINVSPVGNEGTVLVRAHVRLSIEDLGSREHIGVQLVNPRAGEDLVKGAVTDGLKKAATLFGPGLELYGPDYESAAYVAPTNVSIPGDRPASSYARDIVPGATNGPKTVQSPGAPATPAQLNFIRGLVKERTDMVVIGPDGDRHADDNAIAAVIGVDYQEDWPNITKGTASAYIEKLQGK